MALAKYGGIISELRGKEGGVVFSRNKYGSYMKQKITPINPQTHRQLEERGNMGTIAQLWQGLDEEQREAWKAFGSQVTRVNRFGDQTTYTGFNAFMKVNRNLGICGVSWLLDPQPLGQFPDFTFVSFVATTEALTLTFTPTPLGGLYKMVVESTPGIYSGKRFVKNAYRFIIATENNPASPYSLAEYYQNIYGSLPAEGAYIAIRLRMIDVNTGWDTSYYSGGTQVVAA